LTIINPLLTGVNIITLTNQYNFDEKNQVRSMILGCVSSNHNRASMLLREECHMLKKFLKSFSGNSAIPIRHKIKKKPAMSDQDTNSNFKRGFCQGRKVLKNWSGGQSAVSTK
jgi:hypothetical protein